MSFCSTTLEAANRYIDQLTHNKISEFKETLVKDVQYQHCRLNGVFQSNQVKCFGVDNVMQFLTEKLFSVTSDYDVKEWSVNCEGVTASCKYSIEESKNDPDGLQGRFSMRGDTKIEFIKDASSGDLKIKAMWDATSAISVG